MDKLNRSDVYQIVTDRIMDLLNRGIVPWHKPWSTSPGSRAMPRNLSSGKPYRGINIFLLSCAGFESPWFLTYKQAAEKGGNVRKGEKGFPVVFWKRLAVEDKATGEGKLIPLLRYYTVFNVSQCEGIKDPAATPVAVPPEFSPIAEAEHVANSYANGPKIGHGPGGAYYSPISDRINLPPRESFDSPAHYYATLFHELGHSTGHKDRLAREGITSSDGFGNHLYSKEELVAEMTSAMLSGISGIDGSAILDNSAAYIANWLHKLRDDRKLVVTAAAQAQKAADLIQGITWEAAEPEAETAVAA
jgi:antirestriction protein ArdC